MAKKGNGPRISFSDVLANSLFLRAPERLREVAEETRQANSARLIQGNELVAERVEDETQRQVGYEALAVAMKRVARRKAANEALSTAQRAKLGERASLVGEEDGPQNHGLMELSELVESFRTYTRGLRGFAPAFPKITPIQSGAVAALVRSGGREAPLEKLSKRPWAKSALVGGLGDSGHALPVLSEKGAGFGHWRLSEPGMPVEVVERAGPADSSRARRRGFGSGDPEKEGQTKPETWASSLREAAEAMTGVPGVEKIVVAEPAEPGGIRPIEVYFRASSKPTDSPVDK